MDQHHDLPGPPRPAPNPSGPYVKLYTRRYRVKVRVYFVIAVTGSNLVCTVYRRVLTRETGETPT